ncbi:hypothetical protein COO60DRAFT_1465450 [Scenedesmus sp. NREL 46B-D3]|nr:hypothetical protein COO60DRAFT_1465450 [Scenedesmus sp. NREL 46B-D3]
MWAQAAPAAGQQPAAFTVCSSQRVPLDGLYNPYSLSGTILVNGVVASSHSYWFADAAFDALGLPAAWLPGLYQAVLAPARLLFWAMGPQAYTELYDQLDGALDFAQLLSSSGGLVGAPLRLAGVMLLAFAHAAAAMLARVVLSPHGCSRCCCSRCMRDNQQEYEKGSCSRAQCQHCTLFRHM